MSAGFEDPRRLRHAGPIARLLAGAALIAWSASSGLTAWDAIGGMLVLPALAIAVDGLLRPIVMRPSAPSRRRGSSLGRVWTVNVSALLLILAIGSGLTFVTPIDAPAIWLFLGASLLLAAVRGDAGCEALAIPNAIAGRRDETGCVVFAVIDRIEAPSGAENAARTRV